MPPHFFPHWALPVAAEGHDAAGPIGDEGAVAETDGRARQRGLERPDPDRAQVPRGQRAPLAVIEAIQAGLEHGFDAGSIRERELFADCVEHPLKAVGAAIGLLGNAEAKLDKVVGKIAAGAFKR